MFSLTDDLVIDMKPPRISFMKGQWRDQKVALVAKALRLPLYALLSVLRLRFRRPRSSAQRTAGNFLLDRLYLRQRRVAVVSIGCSHLAKLKRYRRDTAREMDIVSV